jgi:hypothetical protein
MGASCHAAAVRRAPLRAIGRVLLRRASLSRQADPWGECTEMKTVSLLHRWPLRRMALGLAATKKTDRAPPFGYDLCSCGDLAVTIAGRQRVWSLVPQDSGRTRNHLRLENHWPPPSPAHQPVPELFKLLTFLTSRARGLPTSARTATPTRSRTKSPRARDVKNVTLASFRAGQPLSRT